MRPIQTDDLKQVIASEPDLLLVNTLDEEHFAESWIPNSINIPQSQADFIEKVQEAAGSKSRPIVVYCASSDCDSSTQGAQKLDEAGFSRVFDYEPGAKGWQEADALLP